MVNFYACFVADECNATIDDVVGKERSAYVRYV